MKYQREVVNWVESSEYHSEMNIYMNIELWIFHFGWREVWKVFILKKDRSIILGQGAR